MMHMLGEICLSVSVLLLAILNNDNDKRIKDLEKRVNVLIRRRP